MKRRDFLKSIGLSFAGVVAAPRILRADDGFGGRPITTNRIYRGGAAIIEDGKVIQPRHEIPLLRNTDVVVVGGGCAGVMAAIAARRAGVRVTLIERYGYCGGLWTGGLVLIVLGMYAGEVKCLQGIGDELMARLAAMKPGVLNYKPGRDATPDPEAVKYLMNEMLREAGVDVLYNAWADNAIVDGNTIKGVVIDGKSGCKAIRAKIVVDATGDGDIYGAAGAAHTRHLYKIGLVHRRGNIKPDQKLGSHTPVSSVRWVNMRGEVGDGLDIETLSRMEMDYRHKIWQDILGIQQRAGCENAFVLETAPQIGVRATRTLAGTHELVYEDYRDRRNFKDVIGVGGKWALVTRPFPLPYGILVPVKLDNLLAAGRCVSASTKMLNYTRVIVPCLLTGHAAGAAAARAVLDKCSPRNNDIRKLQDLLREQGAYLG